MIDTPLCLRIIECLVAVHSRVQDLLVDFVPLLFECKIALKVGFFLVLKHRDFRFLALLCGQISGKLRLRFRLGLDLLLVFLL